MKRFRMEKFAETPSSYPTPQMQELFNAILSLETPKEAANFFRDLLTMAEIKEFANRWQIVKLLYAGESYDDIASKLKVSSATVTRVAYWLNSGFGGYKEIAKRMFQIKFKDSIKKKPFHLRGKHTFLQKK